MMQRFLMAVLFPILALAVVATYAFSLGGLFLWLEHTMHNEWGVVVLGMVLVVIVPLVAFWAQNAVEK